MAIPVISSSSSVLDFPLGETWIFQPNATNVPTSWTWTNLPPGILSNPNNGSIGGQVLVQGIWVSTVTATNASGTSTTLELPISIYSGAWNNPTSIEIKVDATTGTLISPASFALKSDEELQFSLSFYDASANLLALNLASLKMVIKDPSTQEVILQTDGIFNELGSVATRHYEILVSVPDELVSYSAIPLAAVGEFRFEHAAIIAGLQRPLLKITPNFPVTITRNLLMVD